MSKNVRDAVLREFNHRCAICGTANPQIHHIDENPGNNAPENLIPLCPNCHLLDQHDPTSPPDARKLSLFRRYKDPLILSHQFEPLFRRVRFLIELTKESFDLSMASGSANELVAFVTQLEMGHFYGPKIDSLARVISNPRAIDTATPAYILEQWAEEERVEYFEYLTKNSDAVIGLVVELLRYQSWAPGAKGEG